MSARTILTLAAALLALPALSKADDGGGGTASATVDGPPRTVILKTGERVTGQVVTRDDAEVVIASQALGTVTITQDKIDQIIGADGKPEGYVEVKDRGLFGIGLFQDWNRQLEAGLTGTTGTTDSASLNIQLNTNIDNDRYRATFGAWYFLTKTNGTVDRNQTRVFGTYDRRLNGGPWFVFARSQYDNDSLQLWENRISAFAGPGYEFVRNEKYELLGRVGLGYTYEFGGNTPADYDERRVEALIGIDAKWVIDPTQTFNFTCYYTPSIDDFLGEGRIVTTAAYQADLNKAHGLGFRAGVEHTYDFKTPGEDEHNNFKYFVNLLMKL